MLALRPAGCESSKTSGKQLVAEMRTTAGAGLAFIVLQSLTSLSLLSL